MLATLRNIIAWAGKNVIKTSVLIALLIYLGVEVSGLISHRNAIKNAVKVTAFAPPVGSTAGTYAYRVKLGGGATSRQAEIRWIEIDNRAYVTLSNGQTMVDSWTTYINQVKTVTASGNGTTDAGLSFDAGQSDVSYTLGDLTAYIRYDYTIFWTTFNLSIEYDAKVPVPFQNITQEAQQMDDSAWTQEDMEDMAEEWYVTVEVGVDQ